MQCWWAARPRPPRATKTRAAAEIDRDVDGAPKKRCASTRPAKALGDAFFFMNEPALAYLDRSDGWEIGVGHSVVVVDTGTAKALTTTDPHGRRLRVLLRPEGTDGGPGSAGIEDHAHHAIRRQEMEMKMKMKMKRSLLPALAAAALVAVASGAAAQKPIVYPAKGQSAQQQQKDDGECYV